MENQSKDGKPHAYNGWNIGAKDNEEPKQVAALDRDMTHTNVEVKMNEISPYFDENGKRMKCKRIKNKGVRKNEHKDNSGLG